MLTLKVICSLNGCVYLKKKSVILFRNTTFVKLFILLVLICSQSVIDF